jgi:hypothetical protein
LIQVHREASYRLARQIDGRSAYAEVEVRVLSTEGPSVVTLADSVFAWLKDAYGPHAWEWSVCESYRRAAMEGVELALQSAAHEASICIACIHAIPADTNFECVVFAAAHATFQAIGTHSTLRLKIYGVEVAP